MVTPARRPTVVDVTGLGGGGGGDAVPRERRERERQLRILFRKVPGAIWTTDRELRVVQVFGRLLLPLRVDEEHLVGATVYEILGTHDPADAVIAHHLAALAGRTGSFTYALMGQVYEVTVEPVTDDAGAVTGVLGAAIDVTERHRREERLAADAAQLAEAQHMAHVGSWEWNVERDLVTWSDEMYRIYGTDRAHFGGTYGAFLEMVHPDDRESTRTHVLDAFRIARDFGYDHRIVRPDGSVRMLNTRGHVILDAAGKRVRMVGSCADVTERWEITRDLERSVSVLEATLEATADGILVIDRAGKVVAYNQRFATLWGIPEALLATHDDATLIAHVANQLEDPEGFRRGIGALYARPDAESFEVIRFKDGRVFERYSLPQRVREQIVGRVWSFRDVTEHEKLYRRATLLADASRLLASFDAERALQAVAQLAVQDFADGCAVDLFGDGGPRRLFALSRDPARPPPSELPRALFSGRALIQDEGPGSLIAVPLTAHGALLGAMSFVVSNGRRYKPGDLELAEELGRRAALSLENARLYQRAQEAVRARDDFLAIAAHEIRGPITSIHLAAQALGQGIAPASAPKMLEIIQRDDRRLASFVDELLDVGRIGSGPLHFELADVDLNDVVRDAASALGGELTPSGSSLTIRAEHGPVIGRWDRMRVEQVVSNLLGNAIKFGLGKPIEVIVDRRDGRAVLIVRDHGIGIAPEMHERIFEPFERASSVRHYGGLGLGLYIVRTIVDGLGGTIRLVSKPNEGATFTVELPLRSRVA